VLTVAKVTASAAGGYAQYLEGRSQAPEAGDYYLSETGERVEAPGRWLLGAQGAVVLGVDAERAVAAEAFTSVMAVRHPESGEMLRRVGGNGEAVCAIDATFSAPKSVSVVWALASPELRAQIEACQERAVERAVAYATAQVEMTRRRLDQTTVVRERASEVVASSWRHTTARAVAGRAPDPQLHSHTLIHGAIRFDGELVAVDSRSWFVHQRELDAAYLSELAQGMERLGFAVERETGRRARYFELAGVPEGLRERFSGRHAQVQAAIASRLDAKTAALEKTLAAGGTDAAVAAEQLEVLERSGRLLPGEERSVAMQSRASKDAVLATAGDLDRAWWQDAQPFAFDTRTVEELRDPDRAVAPASSEELDVRVLERLTEFEAVFTDRDVRAAALVAGVGLDLDQALQSVDRLAEQGELVALADGRLTTRGHRAMEARTVARARAVAAGTAAPISLEDVEREIAVLDAGLREQGFELAGEQARAVRVACGPGQLSVIEGQAGTGKSTALTAIARAHEQAGQRIVVTSTAALAAERLADELSAAGVDVEGFSTAALDRQIRSGSLPLDRSVTVIHDEAALASTREHDQILGAVERSGARLILVGDPRQSRAVGASGLWERVEAAAREQGGYVQLERIVRAKDPADRRDQALWRSGQHERALAGYDSRGRLVLGEDRQAVEDRALEAAQTDREAGKRTLVVAQTSNEHLDALNARSQAIRAQAGELGAQEVALAGRPYGLRAGDEVQIRHPVSHPDLGRVSNGTTAHVRDVDAAGQSARLMLADGREAMFTRKLLDAAQTRLSYVQHPFPAQGVTTDTAHVIVAEHATAEGSYVALTRARQATHLYATPGPEQGPDAGRDAVVAGLAERMGRTEPEVPSIAVPLAHEQRVEAMHARESRPDPPPEEDQAQQPPAGLRDEIVELRAERDRLAAVLQTYPVDVEQEIRRLKGQAGQAHEAAAGDRGRSEHWQGVYEQLGPLRRRGQDGRQLKDRADEFAERADEQQARGDRLAQQARALAAGPGSPGAWEWTHPDTRAQLYAAETRLAEAVDRSTEQREARPGRRSGEQRWGEQTRWLQGERDRLREQLRSYPHQQAREAEQAEQSAGHDARAAAAARDRAGEAEQEYAQLGRLARRGQRGTQAQARQHALEDQADRHAERERSERERARQIRERPGGPVEWDRAHPGVRERLTVYERAYEQAGLYRTQELVELAVSDRSPTDGQDPFTRTLGPRPQAGARREVWEQGARVIAGYRDSYQINDQQPGVLGAEPRSSGRQHQEWERAVRQVLTARHELGIGDHGLGPVSEQARHVPAITPNPDLGHTRGRGPGFGM
jgi:conjugative relaxase-like TrwC/TraI family protein